MSGRPLLSSPMKLTQNIDSGRLLIGGLGLLFVTIVSVAAGYTTRSHAREVPELVSPSTDTEAVRGVVQTVSAGSLTLITDSGPVTVKVPPSTPVEAVQRMGLAGVKPGDWVNAGGVRHSQTLYALTALVVIPASNLGSAR